MEIVRKEEEERLRVEAEQAWLKAEKERLAEETESMQPMFKRRDEALAKIEAVARAKKEVSSQLTSLCKRSTCTKNCAYWVQYNEVTKDSEFDLKLTRVSYARTAIVDAKVDHN